MPGSYSHELYIWVHICELALAEQRPECRKHLLTEARNAPLQRARKLDDTHGSDLECATLEAAVAVLEPLKALSHVGTGGLRTSAAPRHEIHAPPLQDS